MTKAQINFCVKDAFIKNIVQNQQIKHSLKTSFRTLFIIIKSRATISKCSATCYQLQTRMLNMQYLKFRQKQHHNHKLKNLESTAVLLQDIPKFSTLRLPTQLFRSKGFSTFKGAQPLCSCDCSQFSKPINFVLNWLVIVEEQKTIQEKKEAIYHNQCVCHIDYGFTYHGHEEYQKWLNQRQFENQILKQMRSIQIIQ
ncbi:unnamed protein product (macronuclear) [Paramecium tetraurelia]|uniref:Uncharacterized protein n=1 Tax=Paramecium tetraurelia TaxID=5888 RepID=A0C3A9_PARTE|nr:uncharacterized protein GSPATT00034755001 [Paramecium tetraurelia]CAK65276.1 unnamed protein product [Paramecium tetraurelia]|eukprot:XP_001432673.1 hypothetical protein (macronuclear) [Paramecium tetraurelia strain d4-2]